MNVYIPFNMIVDIDFGIIRLIEQVQKLEPLSTNKLKSFLLNRENDNPILEYSKLRGFDIVDSAYDLIYQKYYKSALRLSEVTDILSFVINTYKLGLSSEVSIVIGCDDESEADYLNFLLSNMKFNIETKLNLDINLNDFDCIFTKYMDLDYCDYLLEDVKISRKRIYVADYKFNTLYDNKRYINIIDPIYQLRLESEGNVLCTISMYNKKEDK